MKTQKDSKSQSNIEKEEQRWRHHPPLLQTTHKKAMVIKTVGYWHTKKDRNQWTRTESRKKHTLS